MQDRNLSKTKLLLLKTCLVPLSAGDQENPGSFDSGHLNGGGQWRREGDNKATIHRRTTIVII